MERLELLIIAGREGKTLRNKLEKDLPVDFLFRGNFFLPRFVSSLGFPDILLSAYGLSPKPPWNWKMS